MAHRVGPTDPYNPTVPRLNLRRVASLPPIPETSFREEVPGVPRSGGRVDAPTAAALALRIIEDKSIQDTLQKSPFMIEANTFQRLSQMTHLSPDALLQRLIPIAKTFANPRISGYHVGAAALGESGNVYIGVNLEFPGFGLEQTVHGEQFAVANARNHGETKLLSLALSAAPCGHCRQFLSELGGDLSLKILTPDHPPRLLSELLPQAFGPQDLGLIGRLLTLYEPAAAWEHPSPVVASATRAAQSSYAPYTKSLSGVGIETSNGTVYSGQYLENAAFNPSLSPFQVALVALVAGGHKYEEITEVVLIEATESKVSHAALTEAMLKSIAPNATFIQVGLT